MKADRLTIAKVFGMFSLSVGLIAASLAFCDEIHEAAKSGNLDEVKALAKANPDVFLSRDTNGESALFLAVLNGRKNVVEFLLTNKADVDATNNNGWTPLDCAALKGRKDLAELLIVNGANVNAQGSGVTPLDVAAANGSTGVAELLISQKANLKVRDKHTGWTPLHTAAFKGQVGVATLLIANNAN